MLEREVGPKFRMYQRGCLRACYRKIGAVGESLPINLDLLDRIFGMHPAVRDDQSDWLALATRARSTASGCCIGDRSWGNVFERLCQPLQTFARSAAVKTATTPGALRATSTSTIVMAAFA